MDCSLVIMAAGMGSRYGGIKQIDGMGPNHEILLEYSVYDALEAGFNKVIFIIKHDFEDRIREMIGDKISQRVQVEYVFQEFDSLPIWFQKPTERIRPYGTVHAVLCAKAVLYEPFVVINADDYYGRDAFHSILKHMQELAPEKEACMVGYRLKNTVSENGHVTRGICEVDAYGKLRKLTETYQIQQFPDGTIRDTHTDPQGIILDPETLVSMNMFGFTPWLLGKAQDYFEEFLKNLADNDLKSEYVLPTLTDQLMNTEGMKVDVLSTNSIWCGVTYQKDKPYVQKKLRDMHASSFYPPDLYWIAT